MTPKDLLSQPSFVAAPRRWRGSGYEWPAALPCRVRAKPDFAGVNAHITKLATEGWAPPTERLDALAKLWKRVGSDFSLPSINLFVQCVARIGLGESVFSAERSFELKPPPPQSADRIAQRGHAREIASATLGAIYRRLEEEPNHPREFANLFGQLSRLGLLNNREGLRWIDLAQQLLPSCNDRDLMQICGSIALCREILHEPQARAFHRALVAETRECQGEISDETVVNALFLGGRIAGAETGMREIFRERIAEIARRGGVEDAHLSVELFRAALVARVSDDETLANLKHNLVEHRSLLDAVYLSRIAEAVARRQTGFGARRLIQLAVDLITDARDHTISRSAARLVISAARANVGCPDLARRVEGFVLAGQVEYGIERLAAVAHSLAQLREGSDRFFDEVGMRFIANANKVSSGRAFVEVLSAMVIADRKEILADLWIKLRSRRLELSFTDSDLVQLLRIGAAAALTLPATLAREAREARKRLQAPADRQLNLFERQVCRTLKELNREPQKKVSVIGYSVDLVANGTKRRIAIECDGRWHFVGEDYDNPQRGLEVLRNRVLERSGFVVLRIRLDQWRAVSRADRRAWLDTRISEAEAADRQRRNPRSPPLRLGELPSPLKRGDDSTGDSVRNTSTA